MTPLENIQGTRNIKGYFFMKFKAKSTVGCTGHVLWPFAKSLENIYV